MHKLLATKMVLNEKEPEIITNYRKPFEKGREKGFWNKGWSYIYIDLRTEKE